MQALYQWVKDPPDTAAISSELLSAIKHDHQRLGTHAFTYDQSYMQHHCPRLWQWLGPRIRVPTRLMRFYVTAPRSRLPAHIDGQPVSVPFGLNFPVLNCEGTEMRWYKVRDSDIEPWKQHSEQGYMSSSRLVDGAADRAELLDSVEITRPCFVRNDIMHSVENPRNTWRIMLSIRFPLDPQRYRTIKEVIDCELES